MMSAADAPHRLRNRLVAAGLAVAVLLWMVTGTIGDDPEARAEPSGVSPAFRVEVACSVAEQVERRITSHGRTLARQQATLSAQVAAPVEAVTVTAGEAVTAGQLLVRLAEEDRPARLAEARALLAQREREYDAARDLDASGMQARLRLDAAAAALEAARARLAAMELELAHTRVLAPFDGVVAERHVDPGAYVAPQTPLLHLVDITPLIAEAYLPQQHFDAVRLGAPARVRLISGETRPGRVVAVAPQAQEATRSFRVEVEVENPSGVPAHTSAEVVLPVGTVAAHRLSPALLSLSTDGALGVKWLADDGRVAFTPVELIRADASWLWVAGLPERLRILTTGAGFVAPGQAVDAVAEETAAMAACTLPGPAT